LAPDQLGRHRAVPVRQQVGVGEPGRERVDGHVAPAQLAGQHPDELLDGALGAQVERGLGEEHLRAAGGRGDDPATVTDPQRRLPHGEERALHVGREQEVVVLLRALHHRLDHHVRRVRHDDVQRAQGSLGPVEQPGHLGRAGQVGPERDRGAALVPDHGDHLVRELLVLQVAHRHRGTPGGQPERDRPADPA